MFDIKKSKIALVRQLTAATFQSSEIYEEICQKMSRCMRKEKKSFCTFYKFIENLMQNLISVIFYPYLFLLQHKARKKHCQN